MNKAVLLIIGLFIAGCATTREQDATIAKWMLPINVGAAYFGSVGLHEGGHALTAMGLGADEVDVYVLPTKDREGNQHLGLTTYTSRIGKFSDRDFTLVNTMGPTAQFLGHVGARELLKTERVPRLLQPTIGWFGLFNQIGFYFHVINGLARNDKTDLGKEDIWVSAAMLCGGLTYDIYDLLSDDKVENRVLVLFGEHFYEPKDKGPKISFMMQPRRGGGFFAIRADW